MILFAMYRGKREFFGRTPLVEPVFDEEVTSRISAAFYRQIQDTILPQG